MTELSEIALVSVLSVLVRWSISLNGYSGAGKPPMYGDFEAQRHWMEVTYNLPVKQWYHNSTDNDLQYWGLDYPPLTAYHSWVCGAIAKLINPSWVALHTSRGIESEAHKLFMRYSVIAVDVLIFFPAVFIYFYKAVSHLSHRQKIFGGILTMLYPGLVLIDHGHFQYNCVSLGFAVWAVTGLCTGHELLGAAAFVMALNYKQMELYHAMPFFCYLLGSCFSGKENGLWKLIKLGVTVVLTFALCWAPFLQDKDDALQVLHRLFPFSRGLYEDKVANIWCSISVIIKLKQILSQPVLIKLCLGTTLAALLPSSIHLLLKPSSLRFRIALVNASLVFFLFSFQVHEKSILIPAVSVCLLLPWKPVECSWFLIISVFSMLPLLIKDQLLVPYVGSVMLFMAVGSIVMEGAINSEPQPSKSSMLMKILRYLSLLGCVVLTVASLTVRPPRHLPDLLPLLVAVYNCVHFLLFLAYFHVLQFSCPDDIPVLEEPAAPPAGKIIPTLEQQVEGQLSASPKASADSPAGPRQRRWKNK